METISVAKFKQTCLTLLGHLDPDGLIITKRGKPIAKVLPFVESPLASIGSLRGKIIVKGDLFSTGLDWKADAES